MIPMLVQLAFACLKQRIASSRALIKNPAILIVDEAISAVDSASERDMQVAIDSLQAIKENKCITIAHRLSTIRNADKIAVIDSGRVAELGSHDELMAVKDSKYSQLVKMKVAAEVDAAADEKAAAPSIDLVISDSVHDENLEVSDLYYENARRRAYSNVSTTSGVESALGDKEDPKAIKVIDAATSKRMLALTGHPWWTLVAITAGMCFGAVFPLWL